MLFEGLEWPYQKCVENIENFKVQPSSNVVITGHEQLYEFIDLNLLVNLIVKYSV